MDKVHTHVVGMMSGTSADGIDCAMIATDGRQDLRVGPGASAPYRPATRQQILALVAQGWRADQDYSSLGAMIIDDHVAALEGFLAEHSLAQPSLIGFHGQTVWHDPGRQCTVQLGDPQALADRMRCPVIARLRDADIQHGGQGAPIMPAYHAAITASLEEPLAVLNIGGVSNVTLIDDGPKLAFDTGPGSAMIDDWVRSHDAGSMDRDGRLAAQGSINHDRINNALEHPYFGQKPPKSLDRNAFSIDLDGLGLEDGASLLTEFSAAAIERSCDFLPVTPRQWLISGGGRHNPVLLASLRRRLQVPVRMIDDLGVDGDMIEAQGMAYLAVRSLNRLAVTYPGTTGVKKPLTGGVLFKPR